MHIAEEGLRAPLPDGWDVVEDEEGNQYYRDEEGQLYDEHPMDDYYR